MAPKEEVFVNVRDFGNNVASKGGNAAGAILRKTGGVANDFRKFIARGNIVELAVGIVMGTAFTKIVDSFVKDLITPVIGLFTQAQLEESYFILRCPDNKKDCRQDPAFAKTTRENAQKLGVVTENYGSFLQAIMNFFIISLVMFFFVKTLAQLYRPKEKPAKEKECPYCCKEVPLAATRCAFCTSEIPADESSSTSSSPALPAAAGGMRGTGRGMFRR